jgi:DNA-binding protein YbaB
MHSQKVTPELLEAIQGDLMRRMQDDASDSTEVSADGLVALTMNGQFVVTRVSITGLNLNATEIAALEEATISCVNRAIQGVARRKGDRLEESIRELQSGTSS